jgi:hypothetical protein
MKKTTISVVLIMLLFSFYLHAQDNETPYQFGFKIAPNLGWMKPDAEGYSRDGMTTGFSWGFVGDYNFSKTYALSTGFTITSNSGKLKFPYAEDSLLGTMHRKYRIRSLEIPIMLKMRTKEIGDFTYYGLIGFGTSFNLSAKADDEFHVETPSAYTIAHQPNIKSRVNFLRESMIVGLGAQYNISGDTQFFVGLLFNNGITNSLKGHNSVNTSLSENAITNYFELNIGILF